MSNLIGTLREYQGCSVAKRRSKSISTTMGTREAKPGGRIVLDICEEQNVQSVGGEKYIPWYS